MTGSLTIGDGSAQTELLIKKADNNTSDHLQFYNGTTRVGEIGVQDTTWLRINQVTNKNIYTPRYIRADNGFPVTIRSPAIVPPIKFPEPLIPLDVPSTKKPLSALIYLGV